jgi:hypothetical protein
MCDHDLLAAPHAAQEMGEDVAGVVGVVLRQGHWRSWLSQASLAALAEPTRPCDLHAQSVAAGIDRVCVNFVTISAWSFWNR